MFTLIIGAGMVGLTAARDLHDAGQTVTVPEARDRTGGRVYTDHNSAGIPVEFGAEFIHGDLAPTWLLVRKFRLRTLLWRKTDETLVRMADSLLRLLLDARLDRAFERPRVGTVHMTHTPAANACSRNLSEQSSEMMLLWELWHMP